MLFQKCCGFYPNNAILLLKDLPLLLALAQIVYKKTDEWYIEWQRVRTSGTTTDNEWQRMRTNGNEWQGVDTSTNSSFFWIRENKEESKHPMENSLNLKEKLEQKRDIKLRAEGSP